MGYKNQNRGLWNSYLSHISFPKCSLGKLKTKAKEQAPRTQMAFWSLFESVFLKWTTLETSDTDLGNFLK